MIKRIKVSKYRRKLFFNFFYLFMAFAVAIIAFQYQREKGYRVDQLESNLKIYLQQFDNYLRVIQVDLRSDLHELDSLLPYLSHEDLRFTLVDTLGNVLYDSYVKNYKEMENHISRPEIQEAIVNQEGSSIRFSQSTELDYYYYAINYGNYFLRAALPYNIKVENNLKVDTMFIYFALLLFSLAAIFLIFMSDKMGKSISELQKFAKQAARDEEVDTDTKFPDNELGSIGRQIVSVYSDLRNTREELSAEREKLFRHLQMSHQGIAVFSSERKTLLANNHFIQYLNTLSDVRAVKPDRIFKIKALKPILKFIDAQLSLADEERAENAESKQLTIDRNGKYYTVQAMVFQDSSFEISITDNTKLEKEKKLKQQMTSNIAHELKTPVSSILGYLETILTQNVDEERKKFFLERSYIQSQRLSALIQDISLLNKLGEASDLFSLEELDVKKIVDTAIEDLSTKIKEKDISVMVDVPKKQIIQGNRSIFYSIWRNLIENSVTYGGDNIDIRIKNYMEDNNFLYYSFSDNGAGIPEKHLSRIFERFYRIDSGRSRNMGGTGLGLSIVKNGVLFHGGEISVKSLKGGGVEFIFSISKQMED